MNSTSFLNENELLEVGFRHVGKNVLISRKSSIYNAREISIHDNVRIDDFCILSGTISIGSFVHISAYTAMYAKYGIDIEDFVTISGRNLIYSQNDDYSGEFMTNPMIPEEFLNVTGGKITFKKFSILGSGCVVLPNLTIEEGSAIGAMSLVNSSTEPWMIYAGIPAKYIKDRKQNIKELERKFKY